MEAYEILSSVYTRDFADFECMLAAASMPVLLMLANIVADWSVSSVTRCAIMVEWADRWERSIDRF